MDTKLYHLNLEFSVTPKCYNGDPEVQIKFQNQTLHQGHLQTTKTFIVDQQLPAGATILSVELYNKQINDTDLVTGQDKAALIDYVKLNGISDSKFAWAGIYEPRYPEPWYSQQTVKPQSLLTAHTYLGWNGKWTLTLGIPVFTWIHQTQNLGWIYT